MSILGGNTQLDVGLPASVPIAAFIADVVRLVDSRNVDFAELDEGVTRRSEHWTLARLGEDAISPSQTLTDADVFDGELLVLRSVTAKEQPAVFDDVIDAVSKLSSTSFRSWTATSARWAGYIAGTAGVVLGAALLAVAKYQDAGVAAGFVAAAVALGALVAATIAARMYGATMTATVLGLCAMVLTFTATALFVPDDFDVPHYLFGFAATLLAAAIGYRASGTGATMFAAVITTSLFGVGVMAVLMIWDPAPVKVGAVLVAVGILVVSMVPRFASGLARLPVPPVPTAGGVIDPADHEPRPTIEGIGAIGMTALPDGAKLVQRARAANHYQSGILVGCAVATVAGAFTAADPFGSPRWQGVALAVIAAVILCLRGRSFADVVQAGTLMAGGSIGLIGLLVGLAVGSPSRALLAGVLLLAFAAIAFVFGVVGPTTEMSPVTMRAGELFEYALIVAIVPLMFWLLDLYSLMRNL